MGVSTPLFLFHSEKEFNPFFIQRWNHEIAPSHICISGFFCCAHQADRYRYISRIILPLHRIRIRRIRYSAGRCFHCTAMEKIDVPISMSLARTCLYDKRRALEFPRQFALHRSNEEDSAGSTIPGWKMHPEIGEGKAEHIRLKMKNL